MPKTSQGLKKKLLGFVCLGNDAWFELHSYREFKTCG